MKRKLSFGLSVLVCALGAGSALAGDLKSPFELETAAVLPKGVRNPRFKNLFMQVENRYNGVGQVEPLGQKLNKRVTWADILSSQDDDTKRATVKGLLSANSIALDGEGPGQTTGVVNTYANVKVPVLAWGITERLTTALAVPIMRVEVSADTGFVASGDGQNFVNGAAKSNIATSDDAASRLNDAINTKLRRLGYEEIQKSMVFSGVGDIKLVNKYNFVNDGYNTASMKLDVTMPTGAKPYADRALDVPLGDGQWDIGAAMIYDHKLDDELTVWNVYGGYTAQLPDKIERRLPTSENDSLSGDKELVSRNLGDQISTGTSLSHFFPSVGMRLGAGYSFQFQTKTSYQDGAFASERYRWLENEMPVQALHATTLTAGFSTVEWFKQKKFKLPFQANFGYSRPIAGRSVTRNDVVAGELVLFF